jgi:hypothetical protein
MKMTSTLPSVEVKNGGVKPPSHNSSSWRGVTKNLHILINWYEWSASFSSPIIFQERVPESIGWTRCYGRKKNPISARN